MGAITQLAHNAPSTVRIEPSVEENSSRASVFPIRIADPWYPSVSRLVLVYLD